MRKHREQMLLQDIDRSRFASTTCSVYRLNLVPFVSDTFLSFLCSIDVMFGPTGQWFIGYERLGRRPGFRFLLYRFPQGDALAGRMVAPSVR